MRGFPISEADQVIKSAASFIKGLRYN